MLSQSSLLRRIKRCSITNYRWILCRHFADTRVGRFLEEALSNYEDTCFMPLRVRSWDLGDEFSKARIDAVQYLRDEFGVREPSSVSGIDIKSGKVQTHLIPFSSFYYNGFHALRCTSEGRPVSFADGGKSIQNETTINDRFLLQFATDAFVTGFICEKDFHEECLQKVQESDDEKENRAVLANHLFSRLTAPSIGKTYYVNDTKHKPNECPCSRRCGDKIIYDSRGFGSELLWYGRPDIMLFPMGGVHCSIIIPPKVDEDLEASVDGNHEFIYDRLDKEVKKETSILRDRHNKARIIACCITLSMYHKLLQTKQSPFSKVTMTPVIATSGDSFDIYLYDPVHDILLRNCGDPIPLWDVPSVKSPLYKLKLSSVLKLWMVINHLSMQPSLSADDTKVLSGSGGFVSHLSKDCLSNIESTFKMKNRFSPINDKEFNFK